MKKSESDYEDYLKKNGFLMLCGEPKKLDTSSLTHDDVKVLDEETVSDISSNKQFYIIS